MEKEGALDKIYYYFETHDSLGIKSCFKNGLNPNGQGKNESLFEGFINMYPRTPEFTNCIKAFLEFNYFNKDHILLAVLQDDAILLQELISMNTDVIHVKYDFKCTFTPLYQATLLHICAEYNLPRAAEVLLQNNLDPNILAGRDEDGFGGHTPIFHTVNQRNNNSLDMLKLLLKYDADIDITVKGLIWGKNYDWETFIPAVNPISYAMMGLLPQFQRNEKHIYEVVQLLLEKKHGTGYFPKNIPNKYLQT